MDGILNVYKEKGYTSHDVVARVRGITGERHIGHTGTLDPAAAGVLPVCLGTATKACELLTDKGKCYETVLVLGIETDTEDTTGKIISCGNVSNITDEMIRDAVSEFCGEILQIPPMFSATRINGQRAYALARQGINIEREAKKVRINEIRIVSEIQRGTVGDRDSFRVFEDSMLSKYPEDAEYEEGRWRWENNSVNSEEFLKTNIIRLALRVDCEKGTYIRTICADLGKKLGCGGCMERLLRTRSGEFGIEESHSLAELEVIFKELDKKNYDNTPEEAKKSIENVLVQADRCFMEYPALHCKEKYDSILLNGNLMWMRHFKEYIETPDPVNRVYDSKNVFRAVYEWDAKRKLYKPVKVFISNP